MRAFVSAAVAGAVFLSAAGSAFAMDPFNGQGWQRSRPPAAVAYFKLPFHATKGERKVSYGLAVTAPSPRLYTASPLLIADTPKLLDLRFNGLTPETLRFSDQVAWSMNPDDRLEAERHNLFGVPGIGGMLLGAALVAGAAYGLYTVVKKKCPAVSTSTGECVEPAN